MSGFLLDTNIPSESWRQQPEPSVAAWLKTQVKDAQFLSVVTVGELRKGAALLPPGAKRTQIEQSIEVLIPSWFGGRILPVTQAIAERWGIFEAHRQLRADATINLHRSNRIVPSGQSRMALDAKTADFVGIG
jgi:toxin FitB